MNGTDKPVCQSRHKFQTSTGVQHRLNGKEFTCELEAGHEGNHTAHSGHVEKLKDGGDFEEVIHWQ